MPSNITDRFNGYVASLAIKVPCVTASVTNITLSGSQTIEGILVVTGDRVLVTGQTDPIENGVYLVTSGAWDRAPDFDGRRDATTNSLVLVARDMGQSPVLYKVDTAVPFIIGEDAITFSIFVDPDAGLLPHDLDSHTDVIITTPTLGDVLRYDGSDWVNYPDSNYAAAVHTHLEADITDLQAYLLDAPSDGTTYGRLNGAWSDVSTVFSTVQTFAGLTDTDTTGLLTNDLTFYDGTDWVPTAGQLLWNPTSDYLQLANAHSVNWLNVSAATVELLQFEELAGSGDDDFPSVSILIPLDGDFTAYGNSPGSWTLRGGATWESQSPYGTGQSLRCQGTNDWADTAYSSDYDFGAGEFTIEGWARFNSEPEDNFNGDLCSLWEAGQSDRAWYCLQIDGGTNGKLRFVYFDGTVDNSVNFDLASGKAANTWYHWAIVRDVNTLRMWFDGESLTVDAGGGADMTGDTINTSGVGRVLKIGDRGSGGDDLNGWIHDLRITKGVARYTGTGAITPPAAALPTGGPEETLFVGDPAYYTQIDGLVTTITSATTNIEGDLTIWDAGLTDNAVFDHDGTDFNTTTFNTQDWNIDGPNFVKFRNGVNVQVFGPGNAVQGQLSHTDSNFQIVSSGASNIQLSAGGGFVNVITGQTFRIWDGTNTERLQMSAPGTDFSFVFVGITDWNVTGLTGAAIFNNEVTVAGDFLITTAIPLLKFYETGEPADEGRYDIRVQAGNMNLRTRTDIDGAGVVVWTVTRGTGTAVTSFDINQHLIVKSTSNFDAAATFDGTVTFTGAVAINNAQPKFQLIDNNATADETTWLWRSQGGQIGLYTATDAAPSTIVQGGIIFNRTGTVVDVIQMPSDGFGVVDVHRNSLTGGSAIQYSNTDGAKGYLGVDDSGNLTYWDGSIVLSGFTVSDTGAIVATSYGGVLEANLQDKTAAETISGNRTYSAADIFMEDNTIDQAVLQDYAIESDNVTVTDANVTLTFSNGPAFEIDLEAWTANRTITISGGPPTGTHGQLTVIIRQDGTAARTITWAGGTFVWRDGTAHVLNSTLNGISIYTFETWDGGTTWYGGGADYS
jgi:hypothetical protein